ncbi:MAG TPA: hypothetical protein VFK86_12430 [Bauldia sp.]|nr:hypothetical protein [Bauldia sp.]
MTAAVPGSALALLLAAALPAVAAGAACGSFVLIGGEKVINVVDNPPAGKSAGDVRAGWRRLADEAGNPVGSVQFVATLTEPEAEGGDVLAGDYYVRLPGGFIAAQTVYQLPDSTDTSQRAQNAVLVVTGGTGSYAGASGTIEIEAGEAPRYVFNLNCR